MSLRCGIDLGTTYSSISWYDPHNNRVITIDLNTADGRNILRSVVFYPAAGEPPVIGESAWNARRQHPERVIVGIKRSMGMDFKVGPIDGKEYTPPEVSAEILKTLIKEAGDYLGEPVREVVITVPAHFGDHERAATEQAGELAGVKVLGLLSEPHAAALAFAVEKVSDVMDRTLLVYDLGGGTFDVTLIRVSNRPDADNALGMHVEALCKAGNAQLGGLDWDRALGGLVADKIQQAHGVDVRQDPANDAVLEDNCEKAKRDLSRRQSIEIVGDRANHQAEVTRAEFEDCTRDLLMTTDALVEEVLETAAKTHGLTRDKIDILLAGGSTKMPMVETLLTAKMGRPPLKYGNPELLVTIGAAYRAHLLKEGTVIQKKEQGPDGTVNVPTRPVITDISQQAVGVEVLRPDGQGGHKSWNSVVIPAGAKHGATYHKECSLIEDGMAEIPIILYEGDAPEIENCRQLVVFTIAGLPPDLKQGAIVKVSLGYDASGIIRGEAIVVKTGHKVDIVVDRSGST